MNFLLISDFYLEELPFNGGAEYNDLILYKELLKSNNSVKKLKSTEVTIGLLKSINKDTKIIVSNFINLSENSKKYIIDNFSYVIYEHDHKYLKSRNPAFYHNFKAPKEQIINYDFYKNAVAVIAQTNFHKKIIELNINTENVINISGNLWSDADFAEMEKNLVSGS